MTQSKSSLAESPESEHSDLILIVDDEIHIRESLSIAVRSFGRRVITASDVDKAVDHVHRSNVDIVLTDLNMPGKNGLDLIRALKSADATVSVVMMTAFGSVETAVEAMKLGAEDYLLKPVDMDVLRKTLDNLREKRNLRHENRRLQAENRALKENLPIRYRLASMLGASEAAQKFMKGLKLYMKTRTPLLILGEPGCQLSELAQILHYNSPWRSNSLIQFDCRLVPEELHQAQLFGSEEQVRDGARIPSSSGLTEKANFGTLILLDIDHLDKSCHGGISRVFNQKKCQRTGGTHFYETDVRIVGTASVKDIEGRVKANAFRWDLWEYMRDNKIEVPPLRQRREDLPILLLAEAKRLSQFYGKEIQSVQPDVIAHLSKYSFPGNYRELESLVDAAVLRCSETTLTLSDFKLNLK